MLPQWGTPAILFLSIWIARAATSFVTHEQPATSFSKTALVHIFFDHGIGIGIANDELALVGAEGNAHDGDTPLASLADMLDEVDVVVAKNLPS